MLVVKVLNDHGLVEPIPLAHVLLLCDFHYLTGCRFFRNHAVNEVAGWQLDKNEDRQRNQKHEWNRRQKTSEDIGKHGESRLKDRYGREGPGP
jgi:hypothetical protein